MNKTPFDRVASDCMAKKIDFPEQLAKQYVRILQKINELWGLPATITYLDELIMPSRLDRQGFSPEVALELVSLKQLHEYTYPVRNLNTWDPYYYINRERFKGLDEPPAAAETPARGEISATGKPAGKPRPSVYKSWFATKGSRQFRNSPIGSLYPAKGFTERTTNPSADPSSNAAVEEILMDAEDLLGIRRIHSAIALYEQAIARYPHYSAYPHLRLLELYYDLDQPGGIRARRQTILGTLLGRADPLGSDQGGILGATRPDRGGTAAENDGLIPDKTEGGFAYRERLAWTFHFLSTRYGHDLFGWARGSSRRQLRSVASRQHRSRPRC